MCKLQCPYCTRTAPSPLEVSHNKLESCDCGFDLASDDLAAFHRRINGLSEIAIYKSLLASANFVDFATVDDGASAHDAHLGAALADFDDEFTALQIQSGRLDGKRPAEGGAEGWD